MISENIRSRFVAVSLDVLDKAQVDRSVAFAILGNIASLIFGTVTALLIAVQFSPELQGYYYTFGSLASLQFFVEIGLGQAVIQFASHEWSKLHLDSKGRIIGSAHQFSRLISLGRLSFKWYSFSALFLIVGVGSIGYIFFSRSATIGIAWEMPWFALCLGIGINFVLMPIFYLLQGCNQTSQFWFYRLIQQIVNGLSLWGAIFLGIGLWAMPVATVLGIVWSGVFLLSHYRVFLASFFSTPSGPHINWYKEVWPVQWRIAVSWLSASFATFIFAPILFQLSSPVIAGQMGMTVTLNLVLLAISSNWVVVKAPRFGVLIAQREYQELDWLFMRSFTVSAAVVFGGAVVIWMIVYMLDLSQHPLGLRLLPPLPMGLFLLATAFSSVNTSLSTYLRAHKKEPLSFIYLSSFIIIITLALLLAKPFGAVGVTAGYLGAVTLFQVPASLIIFLQCRAKWRYESLNSTSNNL